MTGQIGQKCSEISAAQRLPWENWYGGYAAVPSRPEGTRAWLFQAPASVPGPGAGRPGVTVPTVTPGLGALTGRLGNNTVRQESSVCGRLTLSGAIADAPLQAGDIRIWIRADDVEVSSERRGELPNRFFEQPLNAVRVFNHFDLGLKAIPSVRPLTEEVVGETISLADCHRQFLFQDRVAR
ncbi:hypothetical protein [Cryobacterium sp. TMT3-29-2]|uniref:hypothetical protein n=1 Tax=Cryobacterium sp. TMT3-29-2 TaxID=2555867 RepID=UPI00107427FA|nr:hypothetical protein [Cryobacterium sp. TMT3-29-2]TFC83048.1 hypothetical protein E3O67_15480 [Cryobacterium sp. TMT3-29-2]